MRAPGATQRATASRRARGGAARALLAAALVLAGCAGAGTATVPGGDRPAADVVQADQPLPAAREIEGDAERALVRDAQAHAGRARVARGSGQLDDARAEWKEAAGGFLHVAQRFPSSRWRILYRRAAAELSREAGDYEAAVAAAELLRQDPGASPASRAIGTRLAAVSLQALAFQRIKAGSLAPLDLVGAAGPPRRPGEPWGRVVEASDAYGRLFEHDPLRGARPLAAALALLAAHVELAHGNVEEARARLESLFQRWPLTAAAVDGAGPYLKTFAAADPKEYAGALGRLRTMLETNQPKAIEAATSPGAGDEDARLPGRIQSVLQQLRREQLRLEGPR